MAGTGEARCELRIGLVLYGGVALAIYMAGAVQEILRLVRSWPQAAAPESGRAGEGPYAALLRQAAVRPVVDIIAGTSAGGLNGLLLAKALACGAPDLAEVGRLWVEKAGAEALLRRPDPEALLSGGYLERHLWRALRRLDRRADPGLAAQVPVLDLFLTATDLGGVGWEAERDLGARDVFGQPVRGRENLLLFHLRKRSPLPPAFPDDRGARLGYERNDFTAPGPALARRRDRVLARLGRATSAFPVAFPPVRLPREAVLRGGLPDLWRDDPARARERWLSDGGLLLNRPFPPVIRTVFGRVADRPVERVLLYLDPDPEPSGPEPRAGRPGLDRVLAAAAGLRWNEDIRRYLEEVREHNRRVRHYRRALLEAETSAGGPPAAGPVTLAAYRALRRQRLEEYYRVGFGTALAPAGAFLDALLDGNRNGGPPADLDRLDPPYQQRRLQYLIHLVGTFYPRGGPPGDVAAIGRLEAMLWEVHELWREVEWEIFHPGALPPGDPLRHAFEAVAAAPPGSGVPALRALAAAVRRRLENCERAAAERLEQVWRFAAGLPGGATAAPDGLAAILVRAWAGFAERDVLLFPLAEYGGLGEWDEVEVGRLSPAAPTSIRVQARRKLAGEVLAHFGGFLDERWRRSDLLWGRLDTAELLIRLVAQTAARHLPPAEAAALAQRVPELVAACHREILVEEAEALDGRALRALVQRRLPAGGGLRAADTGRLSLPDLVARAPYEVLREYLERYHRVGEEGVLDLPATRLARLGYRATRNLARAVAAAGRGTGRTRFLVIPVALGLWLAGPVVGLGLLAAVGAARWLGRRRPPGADPGHEREASDRREVPRDRGEVRT